MEHLFRNSILQSRNIHCSQHWFDWPSKFTLSCRNIVKKKKTSAVLRLRNFVSSCQNFVILVDRRFHKTSQSLFDEWKTKKNIPTFEFTFKSILSRITKTISRSLSRSFSLDRISIPPYRDMNSGTKRTRSWVYKAYEHLEGGYMRMRKWNIMYWELL